MENNNHVSKRKLWQEPWAYKEGFTIAIGLLIIGFAIEIVNGGVGVEPISFPANLIVLVGLINLLIFLNVFLRKKYLIQWLSSVPASVSAIVLFTFLVLVLGFTTQDETMAGGFSQTFGLWHITSHWAFVLAQLYFLTTLGLVTLKRMHPLTRKNIGFLFNHAGLWITIASAVMGAGDLKRLSMQITENQPFVNTAYSYGKQSVAYQLPFAIKLIDFEIEQYAPKIALMHKPTGKLIYEAGKELPELKTGLTVEMLDWKIQVIEYQELAFTNGGRCVVSTERGASPAAFVKVTNKLNSSTTQSWLNCGSFINTRLDLDIDSALALVMLEPEPKKYSSKIEYITKTDEKKSVVLEVNQPITIEGWKVYQTGFDEQQGRWSQTSGLELVHDPWLPVVYLGVFLMFAGAVYLFGIGKEIGLE